jgi:tape measure domain-containing protein
MTGIVIDVGTPNAKRSKDELDSIKNSLDNIKRSSESAAATLKGMVGVLGSVATSAVGIGSFAAAINEFRTFGNQIALVTGRAEEFLKVQDQLLNVSIRTGTSLGSTSSIFKTFGTALKSTVKDSNQLIKVTEAVSKAVAIQGGDIASASAAINQLGQGLSAGALRGEELNSVMEQMTPIAEAIADSLNVPLGQLREMAAQGKITSQVAFKGILSQADKIDEKFKRLDMSLGQGFVGAKSAFAQFAFELDAGLGTTAFLGKMLKGVADYVLVAASTIRGSAAVFVSTLKIFQGNFMTVFGPLTDFVGALGAQLIKAMPFGKLTTTAAGQVGWMLRSIDDMFDGYFSGWYKYMKFFWVDVFDFDTPVGMAVKNIKRLSPTNWATWGFNRQTFERFFSVETLRAYGKAFAELANAIKGNSNSWIYGMIQGIRSLQYGFRDFGRYLGLTRDTLITFRFGAFETLYGTIAQLIRGITGLERKVYNFVRILYDALGPATSEFNTILLDWVMHIPQILSGGAQAILRWAHFIAATASQILGDFLMISPRFESVLPSFKYLEKLASNTASKLVEAFEYVRLKIKEAISTVYSLLGIHTKFNVVGFKIVIPNVKDVTSYFNKLADAVTEKSMLGKAADFIKNFSLEVIQWFFKIYDDVIAHSWWTDTIDGVVSQSEGLLNRVKGPFERFRSYIENLFKSILSSKSYSNAMSGVADTASKAANSLKGGIKSFSIKLDSHGVKDAVTSAVDTIRDKVPAVFRSIFMTLADVAIALLFPASALKTVLIYAITAASIAVGADFADKLLEPLLNGSLLLKMGQVAGTAAGMFVNGIIADIPKMLNALTSFMAGFIKGFSGEVPVLGSLITSFIDMLGIAGLTGPSGAIGLFLFGSTAVGVLKEFGFFKGAFTAWATTASLLTKQLSGNGGFLSQILLGPLGATRVYAALAFVLTSLGSFDSILGNSQILKVAAEGGLLYTMLLGKKGVAQIKDVAKATVAPLFVFMRAAVGAIAGTDGVIYKMLYGANSSVGTIGSRAGKQVKSVFDYISDVVVQMSATVTKRVADFFVNLFTSAASSESGKKIGAFFAKAGDGLSDFLNKSKAEVAKSKLFKDIWEGARPDGLSLKGAVDDFKKAFGKQAAASGGIDLGSLAGATTSLGATGHGIDAAATAAVGAAATASAAAAAAGVDAAVGPTGLAGRTVFGKFGKTLLIGAFLALLGGVASAATATNQQLVNTTDTAWERMTKNLSDWAKTNPIGLSLTALSPIIAAVVVKGLIWGFAAVTTSIAAAATSSVTFATQLSRLGFALKTLGIGAAFGGVAAGLAGMMGASMEATVAVGVASTAIGSGISLLLDRVMIATGAAIKLNLTLFRMMVAEMLGGMLIVGGAAKAMWLALAGWPGVIIAGLLGVGAAFVSLSGDSENTLSWAEKLDEVMFKLSSKFRYNVQGATALQAKLKEIVATKDLKTGGIDFSYDDSKLNLEKADPKARKNLFTLRERTQTAIDAYKEKLVSGQDAAPALKEAQQLQSQFKASLDRIGSTATKSFYEKVKDMNSTNQLGKNSGWGQVARNGVAQTQLDIAYSAKNREIRNNFQAGKITPEQMQSQTKALLAERDTVYKASYRFADDLIKELQNITNRFDSAQTLVGDPAEINKAIQDAKDAFDFFDKKTSDYNTAADDNAILKNGTSKRKQDSAWAARASAGAAAKAKGSVLADLTQRSREIEAFNAGLTTAESTLDKLKINLDGPGLFVQSSEELKIIQTDLMGLDKLYKTLAYTRNAEERSRIYLEIESHKTRMKNAIEFNSARVLNNPNEVFKKAFDKTGIAGVNADAAGFIGLDKKASLNKLAQSIYEQQTDIDTNPRYRLRVGATLDEQRSVKKAMDDAFAKLEADKAKYKKSIMDVLEYATGDAALLLKANLSGLQLPLAVGATYSAKGREKYASSQTRQAELQQMKANSGKPGYAVMSSADVQKADKELYQLDKALEVLEPRMRTWQQLVGDIQKLGSPFSDFDIAKLQVKTPSVFKELYEDANKYADYEAQLSRRGSDRLDPKAALDVQEKMLAMRQKGLKRYFDNMPQMFNVVVQQLNDIGAGLSVDEIFTIPPAALDSYKDAAKGIARLRKQLEDTNLKFEDGIKLQKQMSDAKYIAGREVRNNMQFGAKANVVEQAFGQDWQRQEKNAIPAGVWDSLTALANSSIDAEAAVKDGFEKLVKLVPAADGMGPPSQVVETKQLTPERRAALQDLQKSNSDAARGLAAPYRLPKGLFDDMFKDLDVQIQDAGLISGARKAVIEGLAKQLREAKDTAESPDPKVTADQRIAATAMMKSIGIKISEEAAKAGPEVVRELTQAYAAGKSFSQSISSEITSGIKEVLKDGKSDRLGIQSIATTFAQQIVDGFVDGMASAIFKKEGLIDRMLGGLQSQVFDLGAEIFGGNGEQKSTLEEVNKTLSDNILELTNVIRSQLGMSPLEKKPEATAKGLLKEKADSVWVGLRDKFTAPFMDVNAETGKKEFSLEKLKSSLSESWGSFKGILSAGWNDLQGVLGMSWSDLGGLLSDSFSSVMSMFGGGGGGGSSSGIFDMVSMFLADGGHVSGPGTGTSDSIPAMLSNGEFVVNSKATKRYAPLLRAINDHQMPRFAAGGFVTPTAMQPMMGISVAPPAQSTNSQATFNISVTGDVSRQTRSQIQQMIPQIAYGVNQRNYEKGTSRR